MDSLLVCESRKQSHPAQYGYPDQVGKQNRLRHQSPKRNNPNHEGGQRYFNKDKRKITFKIGGLNQRNTWRSYFKVVSPPTKTAKTWNGIKIMAGLKN